MISPAKGSDIMVENQKTIDIVSPQVTAPPLKGAVDIYSFLQYKKDYQIPIPDIKQGSTDNYKLDNEVTSIVNDILNKVDAKYSYRVGYCLASYQQGYVDCVFIFRKEHHGDEITFHYELRKSITIEGITYSYEHSNFIDIKKRADTHIDIKLYYSLKNQPIMENNEELKLYEFLSSLEKLIHMPFPIFAITLTPTINGFWGKLNIFFSYLIPTPSYKKPKPETYKFDIKPLLSIDDLIDIDGLEEDFAECNLYSLGMLLDVKYENKYYKEYIDALTQDIESFASISYDMYKKTKNIKYLNNYTIARYKQGIIENNYLAQCLSMMDAYKQNDILPEYKMDFIYYTGPACERIGLLDSFLSLAHILYLLTDIEGNFETILSILDTVIEERYKDIVLEIKFFIELIKFGPGIPNDSQYKNLYINKPLKKEIYNHLTVIKNMHEIANNNFYFNARQIIETLTKEENFAFNRADLSDDEMFNLGLYLYHFSNFEMAENIFMGLFHRGYEKLECAIMVVKIYIAKLDTNFPKDIVNFLGDDISFLNKIKSRRNKTITTIEDIYIDIYKHLLKEKDKKIEPGDISKIREMFIEKYNSYLAKN